MQYSFFPGCDLTRPADSNDMSVLIVGEQCVELENALTSIVALEDKLNSPDKENLGGAAENNPELKIYSIPSLDPKVFNWEDFKITRIDYILILIDPICTTDCHQGVAKMLEYVDPVFYSRKRVDFCYVQRNLDTTAVPIFVSTSKAFCITYRTSFQIIRVDDPDSVAHQAQLCYNKAKRIFRNPLVF